MTDYDSPWKEALEVYFQAFLELFFPHIHADINWSRGFTFLDKELQKIVPEAARGRLYVDKLVKVWCNDGDEAWVLIHIEVQAQRDADFPKRMYRYNGRITDTYDHTVVSLAILADDDPHWRPDHHGEQRWGWSVRMGWTPVKLLDYADRTEEMEKSPNPFAKVVLAHLKALETRDDPVSRSKWKFRLVRGLYKRGFTGEDVRQIRRFMDWLMELPPTLRRASDKEIENYEEERRMPFYDLGQKSTMLRMIEDLLRTKFGEPGVGLMPAIKELQDGEKYLALNRKIAAATTVDEVRKACARAAARRKKDSNDKDGSSKP